MQIKIIHNKIFEIRGQNVLLDFDIAELYEVSTKVLNQAVKRNPDRFPERFMFRLTVEEWEMMRSQFVTASNQSKRNTEMTPFAFTEHGVTMLASILRSKIAVKMNIAIVEAFIALKEFALSSNELSQKLKQLEIKYNQQFKDIYDVLNFLLNKNKIIENQSERKRIGYK